MMVNPVHMAAIYTAFSNNGNMLKPYLVKENGSKKQVLKETIFTKQAVNTVNEAMRQVIRDPSGTGHAANIEGVDLRGKTGTAENEGKYAHAWFVGYSNVEDPDLVVCVLVENVGAGSKYAVPIAKRVFDSYYNNNMKEYYSQKTDIESTQTNQ